MQAAVGYLGIPSLRECGEINVGGTPDAAAMVRACMVAAFEHGVAFEVSYSDIGAPDPSGWTYVSIPSDGGTTRVFVFSWWRFGGYPETHEGWASCADFDPRTDCSDAGCTCKEAAPSCGCQYGGSQPATVSCTEAPP